jgi:hypothetical protein
MNDVIGESAGLQCHRETFSNRVDYSLDLIEQVNPS